MLSTLLLTRVGVFSRQCGKFVIFRLAISTIVADDDECSRTSNSASLPSLSRGGDHEFRQLNRILLGDALLSSVQSLWSTVKHFYFCRNFSTWVLTNLKDPWTLLPPPTRDPHLRSTARRPMRKSLTRRLR